jgi:alpha-N-acetylglucosaminidase
MGFIFSFNICYAHDPETKQNEKASYDLIKRILPAHYSHFKVKFIPKNGDKDVFELESKNGKIEISGNDGVSIASGLYYYLKNYANCQITWNGTNLKLPSLLPVVPHKVRKNTPYDYRYYLNYCTFSYTMSWWTWERWEKEIDWMALHGINLPLALTGQNAVWYRVYKELGFTDQDLKSFFSGPTYFGWFWMGNIDGIGGPLPKSFMDNQEKLQKQILERERSLGMTPILPAFTGHVPPSFKEKFPNAKLKMIEWGGRYHTNLLDPTDPLFQRIGSMFMHDQIQTFGTNHLYSADTFNENTPPANDSTFLSNVSDIVYKSMSLIDSEAVWVMQGWLFVNNPKFWQPAQINALFNAVPDKKMIVLDLWSETRPVWSRTSAYYGKPWIWCMLLNFGGNVGMFGKMDVVASGPSKVLNSKESGEMRGLGLTPEGIEQNPVMYELMMDNVWCKDSINLNTWLNGYVRQRYGKFLPDAYSAWQVLRKTVYNGAGSQGASESILTGRPTFNKDSRWTSTALDYDPKDLLPAWKLLINCSAQLKNSDGFRYDIVDLTSQVLANYADELQQEIAADYKNKNLESFKVNSNKFLNLLDDIDMLLLTRKDFLLGKWVNDAGRMGTNKEEKLQFERNAKTLITLWSDKDASLHEYACKQWAGMVKSFYKPRWEQFFTYTISCMKENKTLDEKWFDDKMKDWEWAWVNNQEKFTEIPSGNSVESANDLFKKYSFLYK